MLTKLKCVGHFVNRLFDDRRLMIAFVMVWLLVCLVGFGYMGIFTSDFMRFGPQETSFTFLTISINSWERYIFLCTFVIISTAVNDLAGDSLSAFFTNNVLDHKERTLMYEKRTILCISQLWSLYCAIMSLASINLAFSQMDMILLRLVVDLSVNFYTMHRFMKNKRYDPDAFHKKYYEEQGDAVDEEVSSSCDLPVKTTRHDTTPLSVRKDCTGEKDDHIIGQRITTNI